MFKKILLLLFVLYILNGCGGGSTSQTFQSFSTNPPQTEPQMPVQDAPQINQNPTESVEPPQVNLPPPAVKTVVIPLYSYPTTYKEQYEKLYKCNMETEKEMIIILNPSNGAGENLDKEFTDTINNLKQKGYKVFGYIHSMYTSRQLEDIKLEISKYNEFYPDLDGFFIDEVSNNTESYDYYKKIYEYINLYKKLVILNAGTTVPSYFYNIADYIIVFERDYEFLLNKYSLPSKLTDKDCFLVYGVNTYQTAQETKNYLLNKGASCIYLIDENPPSWFKVSPYLDLILQ